MDMDGTLLDKRPLPMGGAILFWLVAALLTVTGVCLYLKAYVFLGYVMLAVFAPVFVILIPLEPTIGILVMFVVTGLDFLGRLHESGPNQIGFHLTMFHVALFVTFVSVFLNLVLKKRTFIRLADLWPPLIVFIFVLALSLLYTPNFIQGSYLVVQIIVMGLITLIVIETLDRRWKVGFIVWTMVVVPAAIGVLTMYQLMSEGAIYSPMVSKMATSLGIPVYRSTGTFMNPNELGCFMMIGIVMGYGLMFHKGLKPWIKLILVALILCSVGGILASFSRAGWLSTLIGMMIITAMHRKWSYYAYFFGFMTLMLLLLIVTKPEIWEAVTGRFASIFDPTKDESSSSRISLIRTCIWMWQDNPILGVGIRGFPKLYYEYVDPNMPQILIEVNEAHTIQAEILAEQGLIGLTAATWLFVTVTFHGLKWAVKLKDGFLRTSQIAMTALMLGYIVNFTFASDFINNTFWMTVGMLYAIPFIEIDENDEIDVGKSPEPEPAAP
jgi:O-antigen ligase